MIHVDFHSIFVVCFSKLILKIVEHIALIRNITELEARGYWYIQGPGSKTNPARLGNRYVHPV
jgi:hypothetical protein